MSNTITKRTGPTIPASKPYRKKAVVVLGRADVVVCDVMKAAPLKNPMVESTPPTHQVWPERGHVPSVWRRIEGRTGGGTADALASRAPGTATHDVTALARRPPRALPGYDATESGDGEGRALPGSAGRRAGHPAGHARNTGVRETAHE